MSRLTDIGTNPTIRNFARDASQNAIRKVASFLAPTVEVPTLTGKYKIYDAEHRYKRAATVRAIGGRATRIGFDATDANYALEIKALDFPIDYVEELNDEGLLSQTKYGAQLLADAAALDHEATVIERALATLGAGTNQSFGGANFDPVDWLDGHIMSVMKNARNGAPVRVLFGPTAFRRFKSSAAVIARFNGVAKGLKVPNMDDVSQMLFGQPECEVALMVSDTADAGVTTKNIQFLLDNQIIVFAANGTPNTMDPSFMKTFRLMGNWMRPGTYRTEDERGEVLKMDWLEQVVVTNPTAAVRLNANA